MKTYCKILTFIFLNKPLDLTSFLNTTFNVHLNNINLIIFCYKI